MNYPMGLGIGGYTLNSKADKAFALDYDSSGKLDHIVVYRPGQGAIYILKNSGLVFSAVFKQGDPGSGIGGYNLSKTADKAFAFDYDSSGKLDHIVLYRPGQGAIFILKRVGADFTPVYHQGDPGSGIGGWNLRSTADRAFAFDFDGSGKLDHLVFYRPGQGAFAILKRQGTAFVPAIPIVGDPGPGIGGYNLKSVADEAFAFDYDGSGKQDHLVFFRPGQGAIFILKRIGGKFSAVFEHGDPGPGIGGWNLRSTADRAFAFDYDGTGKLDHLVFYRPGQGAIFVLRHAGQDFAPVYQMPAPGSGIGGYPLDSTADFGFAFDFDSIGKQNYLVFMRPGGGFYGIVENDRGSFRLLNTLTPPFEPTNLTINGGSVKNAVVSQHVLPGAVFAWTDPEAGTSIGAVSWKVNFPHKVPGSVVLGMDPEFDKLAKPTVTPGLLVNEDYVWNVQAFNEAGGSAIASAKIHTVAAPIAGPVAPVVTVQAKGDGSFVVNGTGFAPNSTVTIRIVDKSGNAVTYQVTANGQGAISFATGVICQQQGEIYISATDDRRDPTNAASGILYSNVVTVSC